MQTSASATTVASIDESGAERQPERHFYREYAEADPNMRYSRRGASASGQRNGSGDFDYDIFADLFRGRGEGGNVRMPPQDVHYTLEIDFLERTACRGWRGLRTSCLVDPSSWAIACHSKPHLDSPARPRPPAHDVLSGFGRRGHGRPAYFDVHAAASPCVVLFIAVC